MTTKGFIVTGRAAHERIARLFVDLVNEAQTKDADNNCMGEHVKWVDLSPYASLTADAAPSAADTKVEFIWENASRHATKSIRDLVTVYSHLPNGSQILDDKWVLARLLGSSFVDSDQVNDTAKSCRGEIKANEECKNRTLATLESHCFRGADFVTFANRVGLLSNEAKAGCTSQLEEEQYQFEDLLADTSRNANGQQCIPPPAPDNLWVIKDAMSNGAGGIWVLDCNNIDEFLDQDSIVLNTTGSDNHGESVLHPDHRYIAQRYSWPPVLYGGRKCHVRVYGCITSKGEAFVHKRAFLHVANDTFQYNSDKNGKFKPSVHITNCCANSHDVGKFAGEICADLLKTQSTHDIVALGPYFPSIAASLAELAQKSAPFLRGGRANNGFEYLGMDFVLSSVPDVTSTKRIPVAYLLEVNAPPSQDTATGLMHAEHLHDEVISDLLKLCVLPELGIATCESGGWNCVYQPEVESTQVKEEQIVQSKHAFVNKVRWHLFEKKAAKEYEMHWNKLVQQSRKCESLIDSLDHDAFALFVRSQFPYFSSSKEVFLESGGGAQVPKRVMDSMMASMMHRDRSVIGANTLKETRRSLLSLLTGNGTKEDLTPNSLFMGSNATSLLEILAQKFSDEIQEGDEIILASENHLANVLPWVALANRVRAQVKWWTITDIKNDKITNAMFESTVLSNLVTSRTKLVAISHSSNILGCVRDIPSICQLVHNTAHQAHVVVDGVAAAPHMLSSDVFAGDILTQPDWYVVSLHKLFGPHLGCLIGKERSARRLLNASPEADASLYKLLEMGTMNFEACSAALALEEYFQSIVSKFHNLADKKNGASNIQCAKMVIQSVEERLVKRLLCTLAQSSPLVIILQDPGHQQIYKSIDNNDGPTRLPFVSFVHANIGSNSIVEHCRSRGVICRACKFLSTERFWNEMGIFICDDGIVRFSLAHYNTTEEIAKAIEVLEMIDGWA